MDESRIYKFRVTLIFDEDTSVKYEVRTEAENVHAARDQVGTLLMAGARSSVGTDIEYMSDFL